jgi:hypothetical protein
VSIYPPLKQRPPLKSSQSKGESSHIFILTAWPNILCFILRKSWISSKLFVIFWTAICVKYLFVFKRFCVERFVWIRRLEIFIFQDIGFYLHVRVLCNTWPIRSSFSRDDVKLMCVGALWPVESISVICRVTWYKRHIVLTFLSRISGWDYLKLGPEM